MEDTYKNSTKMSEMTCQGKIMETLGCDNGIELHSTSTWRER